jgi:hypothetical protein
VNVLFIFIRLCAFLRSGGSVGAITAKGEQPPIRVGGCRTPNAAFAFAIQTSPDRRLLLSLGRFGDPGQWSSSPSRSRDALWVPPFRRAVVLCGFLVSFLKNEFLVWATGHDLERFRGAVLAFSYDFAHRWVWPRCSLQPGLDRILGCHRCEEMRRSLQRLFL